MTNEQIRQWARDAGFHKWYSDPEREYHFGCVKAFAALVRNATLEEAAQTILGEPFIENGVAHRQTLHGGSWQEKSVVGLFVEANAKKLRSLKNDQD